MNARTQSLAVVSLVMSVACTSQNAPAPRSTASFPAVTVIRNVVVIDGTGAAPRPNVDVVIEGEKITAVGHDAGANRANAAVIDGAGRYVIPGLIDMHAHLLVNLTNEKGEIEGRYDQAATIDHLRLFVRHGVTTVRDPGSRTADAVVFRELVRKGTIVGPEIFTAGRILNSSNFNPEPFVVVRNEEAIRAEIQFQAAAGVDAIKVYSSMTPELVRIAVDEAARHGLPVIGHLQRTTWTEGARLGIRGVEHAAPWSAQYVNEAARESYPNSLFGRVYWLENLDWDAVAEMVRALATHSVVADPTLMAMHTKFWADDPRYTESPDLALVSERVRSSWRYGSFTKDWTAEQYAQAQKAWPILLRFVKAMHDGGVHLVAGTDTPTPWIVPGASMHDELQLLADSGIAPLEVIRIATYNAARALRRDEQFGAVLPGLRADLLLLHRNPADNIANTRTISAVIQRGKVVFRR